MVRLSTFSLGVWDLWNMVVWCLTSFQTSGLGSKYYFGLFIIPALPRRPFVIAADFRHVMNRCTKRSSPSTAHQFGDVLLYPPTSPYQHSVKNKAGCFYRLGFHLLFQFHLIIFIIYGGRFQSFSRISWSDDNDKWKADVRQTNFASRLWISLVQTWSVPPLVSYSRGGRR